MSTKALTLAQTADELGVVERTVRRLIADKKMRAVKVGRVIRVRRADLDDYIVRNQMGKP